MKNSIRPVAASIYALALALSALSVGAATAEETGPCGLRIATGPSGKVFERLFSDIRSVCGEQVSVCAVPSEGGLQNLMLLSANQADLGMAQIDTLADMRDGDENVRGLQAVMPLHANLLHIVTRTDGSALKGERIFGVPGTASSTTVVVRKSSELKGLTVALVGSAQLLGRTLEKRLGYGMRFIDVDTDEQAIARLRSGDAQAVFTMGGWPIPSITRLKADSGLTLASYDLPPQPPFQVVKRNYQNVGAFNHSFLAAPNLLVTRPFKPGGVYGKRVAALQSCLVKHLDDLQEGNFQPAWKEIKNVGDTLGWAAFPATSERKTAGK